MKITKNCLACEKEYTTNKSKQKYCSFLCKYGARDRTPLKELSNISTVNLGASSELIVCAKFLKEGYDVFRSVSAACFCDLIIIKDGTIETIEVRTARRSKDGLRIIYPFTDRGNVNKLALYIPETNEVIINDYVASRHQLPW